MEDSPNSVQVGRKIERLETQMGGVQDWLRSSMNAREERAESKARLEQVVQNISVRVGGLEAADKALGDRIFQVWIGVGFAFLGIILELIFK